MSEKTSTPFHLLLIGIIGAATVSLAFGRMPNRLLASTPVPASDSEVAPASPAPAKEKRSKKDKNRKLIDAFFSGSAVNLDFVFKPGEWDYLKRDPRRYVEAQMIEHLPDGTTKTYPHVAVKLKGSAGSFRGADDKPGITVSLSKFKGADRFHGLEKFHLNNGAQDPGFLNETIGGEMARAGGVPASRCNHAVVKWNGRDLGVMVLKESFNKDFLTYFFEQTNGSLYENTGITDLNDKAKKDQGDANDTADLKALIAACKEGTPEQKWANIGQHLNVESFLRMMAMENFLNHWDGYGMNRNNYRIYFDPQDGKANFFLHGMDQVFDDANRSINLVPESLVGSAVWSNPQWKARYQEIVEELYQKAIKSRDWEARLTDQANKIATALEKQNPQAAKDYQAKINSARDRIMKRLAGIGKQMGELPKPFGWKDNVAPLAAKPWTPKGAGTTSEAKVDGADCLHIKADASNPTSWRLTTPLEPGRYRFEAQAKVGGVEGGESGVVLRLSGAGKSDQSPLASNPVWQKVGYEFDYQGGDAILVAELRSPKGEAWFQKDSLQLVRLR